MLAYTLATGPVRGHIWWGEIEGVGRQPFLIMTRSAAIQLLAGVLATPISRTIRGIPTEMRLGPEDGMPTDCVAGFDDLTVIPKAHLVTKICELLPGRLPEACTAMNIAIGC